MPYIGLFIWVLALPVAVAQAQACSSENVKVINGDCTALLCCPGLVCNETEEVVETGRDSGVLWTREKAAVCVTPAVGEPLEGAATTEPDKPVIFKPQVGIPGSITIGGQEFSIRKGEGVVVDGSTLARYVAVFYRFFITLLMVSAVTMISWGGFKRLMAAGSEEMVKDSNDIVFKAIIGLVLALISYSLLNLINPKLTQLEKLEIYQVKRENLQWETEEQLVSQAVPTATTIMDDPAVNLAAENGAIQVDSSIRDKVLLAAQALRLRGYGMYLTSSYRTPERQQQLINQNCPAGAKRSSECSPPTCLMLNGPTSCPHTTGRAVDVWGTKDGRICIAPPEGNKLTGYCSGNGKSTCLSNPCQSALIEAMKAQGFCLLGSEPWHFEQPKMSSQCYL